VVVEVVQVTLHGLINQEVLVVVVPEKPLQEVLV
jgi:hypothetical protein